MNKLIFVMVICIAISKITLSQSVFKEAIKFKYQQPSLYFLNEKHEYACEMEMIYQEDVENKLEEIKIENERRTLEAKEELEAYNNKSTGSKVAENILLSQKKPSGIATLISIPFTQKVWDEEVFLNSYLKVSGLTKDKDAKEKVKIVLDAFTIDEKVNHSEEKGYISIVTVATHATAIVYNSEGSEIYSKLSSQSSSAYKSSYYSSESECKKKWQEVRSSKLRQLENEAIKKTMKFLRSDLTANIGYPTKDRKTYLFLVKEKKFSYTELNDTYAIMAEAYALIQSESQKNYREEKIRSAIAVWEHELEEKDLKDKKARINPKVSAALFLNIAEAYFWINDFDKARQYLAKHTMVDVSGYRSEYSKIDKTVIDYKKRYEANDL